MKRLDMIRYVQSAEGVPDSMKAAAVLGISLMPKSELGRFSELADRGLLMVKSGDYDGVLALLREVDAPPDVIAVAEGFLKVLPHGGTDSNSPSV